MWVNIYHKKVKALGNERSRRCSPSVSRECVFGRDSHKYVSHCEMTAIVISQLPFFFVKPIKEKDGGGPLVENADEIKSRAFSHY